MNLRAVAADIVSESLNSYYLPARDAMKSSSIVCGGIATIVRVGIVVVLYVCLVTLLELRVGGLLCDRKKTDEKNEKLVVCKEHSRRF